MVKAKKLQCYWRQITCIRPMRYIGIPSEFEDVTVKASVSFYQLHDRFRKTSLVCMSKSLKRESPLWKIGRREKI